MNCKSRYLKPAFWMGHRFVSQVFDYHDSGKRILTCHCDESYGKGANCEKDKVVRVALLRIPRGWRVDRSEKVIASSGQARIPLTKRIA